MITNCLRKTFVIWASLLSFPLFVDAASQGTSIFPFLKISVSARAAAMGELTGLPDAASAADNPAGMPWMKDRRLTLGHMLYLGDSQYSSVAYSQPAGRNAAVGGAIGYLGVGNLVRTIADGSTQGYAEQGSFQYYDAFASVMYGKKASREFSYGVALKGARESIDTSAYTGIMATASGLYRPYHEPWQLGFGVFNVGPAVDGYDLPAGAYLSVYKLVTEKVLWGGELVGYFDQASELRTGIEAMIDERLALRAGYRYYFKDPLLGDFPMVNLTAGAGFMAGGYEIDYAWLPYGDLGSTHRLTMMIKL